MSSTHRRRRGKSLHLDIQSGASDRPPLAALFLVQFDAKAGYTISWKRSESGLELQDSVEFKSLPSGLHNVQEDLIYFMHGDDYAGISAFRNRSTEQWERNALMLAVGALVPLDQGRLGRSWKHATDLRKISQELVKDPSKTEILQEYWEANQPAEDHHEDEQQESELQKAQQRRPSLASVGGHNKRKSIGSLFGGVAGGLSPFHPARSINSLVETFGPLIFPLYKAALLRKRILLLTEAPIQETCNFVYDLSIISNIPSSLSELVPLEPLPTRLQPLFSVGVHDLDDLSKRGGSGIPAKGAEETDLGYGWISCTTDDVLGMKTNIYDLTINVPPQHTKNASEKVWPTVNTSAGQEIKASQRDSRRFRVFRQSQKRAVLRSRSTSPVAERNAELNAEITKDDEDENLDAGDDDDQAPLLRASSAESFNDASSIGDDKVIEPLSWSALAYNSFMWWASAGEKRADLDEETEHDASMFRNIDSYSDRPGSAQSRRTSSSNPLTPGAMTTESNVPPEMAVIAYFHRFTTIIFERLADLVENADNTGPDVEGGEEPEGKDEEEKSAIYVGSDDVRRMGLDVWSESDRRFIEELVELYFGRKADVQGGHIECCGVRIV